MRDTSFQRKRLKKSRRTIEGREVNNFVFQHGTKKKMKERKNKRGTSDKIIERYIYYRNVIKYDAFVLIVPYPCAIIIFVPA